MKLKRFLLAGLVLIVVAGLAATAYAWYRQYRPTSSQQVRQTSPSLAIGDAVAKAVELAASGKRDEALAVLDSVKDKLTNDQDKYQLYSTYGTVYMQQKDYVRAYDAYKEVTALRPNEIVAQFNLGLSAQRTADYSAAIAAFEQAQKLKNDKTPTYIQERSAAGIPASRARQAELAAYDQDFVRALGRYTWYEVSDNEAGMTRVYPSVAAVVTDRSIDQKTIDDLRAKLSAIIFADQAI